MLQLKKINRDDIDSEGVWLNLNFNYGLDVKVIITPDDEAKLYEFQWDDSSISERDEIERDFYVDDWVSADYEYWKNK